MSNKNALTRTQRSRRVKPFVSVKKAPKRYPQMITASDAEISEWNSNVQTRQVQRQRARSL